MSTTIFVLLVGTIFVVGYGWVFGLVDNKQQLAQENTLPSPPTSTMLPLFSDHNIDKDCGDFFDQSDAQNYYIAQGGPQFDPDQLDLNHNGKACENYPYAPKDKSVPPSKRGVENPKFFRADTSKVNTK